MGAGESGSGGGSRVWLWGEREAAEALVAVSVEGVIVRRVVGGREMELALGLERVREVEGALADEFEALREAARSAWRARARLERGDPVGAEPLFESLLPLVSGSSGPTAAGVADGLMRCRVQRQSRAGAVWAWLWLMRMSGGAGPVSGGLGPMEDSSLGLVAELPPIWMPGEDAAALDAGSGGGSGGGSVSGGAGGGRAARAALLEALYRESVVNDLGVKSAGPGLTLLDRSAVIEADAGVQLVYDVVASQRGAAELREDGRRGLRRRIEGGLPGWAEAWARCALGRSLLREPGHEDRLLGVVELLHVHVRLSLESPHLAAVSLAQAASALEGLGEAAEAERLRADLLDVYGGHPAIAAYAGRGVAGAGGLR